jgi:UDP-glucose 4-epimerase
MRACVTGGAGFIGSHLVDRLLADGWDVSVLDDLSSGLRANLAQAGERVRLHVGDLRAPADVAAALEGAEVVLHLGARASVPRSVARPEEAVAVNVQGTLHVLEAARRAGVRRIVLASSSSVYGAAGRLPRREDDPLEPRSPYAATKAGAEGLVRAYGATFGLDGVVLRFFNVYGPRQRADAPYAAVVPRFADALAAGRPLLLEGDGAQTRDFTYVADVVDALVQATAPAVPAGSVLNVGSGSRVSVRDLAAALGRAAGRTPSLQHAPARPGDVRDSQADVRRAAALLGWAPRTSLAEGLAHVVESWPPRDGAVEAGG